VSDFVAKVYLINNISSNAPSLHNPTQDQNQVWNEQISVFLILIKRPNYYRIQSMWKMLVCQPWLVKK